MFGRPTNGPEEGGKQGIFAAAMVTAQKDSVIDLVPRELYLVGQRIEEMLALETLGHHALYVGEPLADVPGHGRRARIAPAVAVDLALTGHQHGRPGGVGDANQGLRALALAVLIEGRCGLNAALGVVN